MRTNFQQRSRRGQRIAVRLVLVLTALVLTLALWPGPFARALSFVTAPLFEARVWVLDIGASIPRYFSDRSRLIAEIESLRSDLAEDGSMRAELDALRQSHNLIQEATEGGEDRIVADVIRTPPETPYDTLVVAAGSDAGILSGAYVYSGRTAIGQVAVVNPKTSLIVLFSTPGVHVPVYLWGDASVFAQAEGQGGGVVRVGVPQGLSIKEGDAVTLPLPGTAVFGTINHIEADATNPEQYAYITQEDALRSIRFVAIDRNVAETISPEDAARAVEMVRTGEVPSPLAPILESLPSEIGRAHV